MGSLIRWSPFEEMANLHREMDRMFDWVSHVPPASKSSSWIPATDVTSSQDGWTLRMALPGVESNNVRIDFNGRMLAVSGERSPDSDEVDARRRVSEIGYGRFERSFTLPDSVAADKVSARFDNGMLVVTLPVADAAKPRRIEIADGVNAVEKVA